MPKFMDHAKHTGLTVAEVGVLGTTMLLQKKFLDFKTLFANQIKADPTYANNFWIKHEGGIKLVGFALAASFIKNPWIKLALIGVAVAGFVQEVRVLTTQADGTNFFDQIGKGGPIQTGADNSLDAMMKKAAEAAAKTMGEGNYADMYNTAVGAPENYADMYATAVGGGIGNLRIVPSIDNDNSGYHAVGIAPMQTGTY